MTDVYVLLTVLFNIGILVLGASLVTALVARWIMKRKRLAAQASFVMITAGAVMFTSSTLLNVLDNSPLSVNVLGLVFILVMVLGMRSTWRQIKTLKNEQTP